MPGLVETAFSIVKPNVVPTFPTAPYYTSMVPVKKAKLDDVKSLMKYLSQSNSDYINSIPELYLPEERMMMKGRMISDFHHTCITCDLPIPVHNLYYIMCMLRLFVFQFNYT